MSPCNDFEQAVKTMVSISSYQQMCGEKEGMRYWYPLGFLEANITSFQGALHGHLLLIQPQVLQQKVEGAWNDMLTALSASTSPESGDACREDEKKQGATVTAESWIARATAMSLCSRDPGSESGSASSRREMLLFLKA